MKNQKGFTLVEGLLIIVILFAVGFAGWFVWNKTNENDGYTQQTNVSSNTEQSEGGTDDSSTVNEQSTKDGYVFVADWGVFIGLGEYSDKISVSEVSTFGDESSVRIIVNPQYDFYKDCETSISISRIKDVSDFDSPPKIKLGEYYYRNSGVSECGGAAESGNQNVVSFNDLINAFESNGVR